MVGLGVLYWKLENKFELQNETDATYTVLKVREYLLPLWRTEADLKHACKYFAVCPGVFALYKIVTQWQSFF